MQPGGQAPRSDAHTCLFCSADAISESMRAVPPSPRSQRCKCCNFSGREQGLSILHSNKLLGFCQAERKHVRGTWRAALSGSIRGATKICHTVLLSRPESHLKQGGSAHCSADQVPGPSLQGTWSGAMHVPTKLAAAPRRNRGRARAHPARTVERRRRDAGGGVPLLRAEMVVVYSYPSAMIAATVSCNRLHVVQVIQSCQSMDAREDNYRGNHLHMTSVARHYADG
jgi:hypothetical protein